MKIVVYAISKNESKFAKRFCEAARDADMIFVADTGSTDNTVQILEEAGAHVVHLSIKPWRFDDARNAALALLPAEFDVCVSLDLDEVLQPGWREEIERLWVPGTTRLRYLFDWGCDIVFMYEKIHARYGYRWKNPCHEYPVTDRSVEVLANTQMVMVKHEPDPTKSRGQYLELLAVSVKEDPLDARNALYYARELSFHGKWQEAIDECERYLKLPSGTCANERAYAMLFIGKGYQVLEDNDKALCWIRRATAENPNSREPWCDLARACYLTGRWTESLGAALTCLSIERKELLYNVDPAAWGAAPHDWASIAAWNLELYQLSYEHAKKAVELEPEDLRLRRNLEFCQQKVA